MRKGWLLLLLLAPLLTAAAEARADGEVKWKARLEPADARAGEGAQVVLEATIKESWHLYSLKAYEPGKGPANTRIELLPNRWLTQAGDPVQPEPLRKTDPNFDNAEVEQYAGAAAFGLPVRLAAGASGEAKASVKVRFQACTEGLCISPTTVEVPLAFRVARGPARPDRSQPVAAVPTQPAGAHAAPPGPSGPAGGDVPTADFESAKRGGLLTFLWWSILAGFLALLTPCVFPMIPITVSYFSKQRETTGRSGLGSAAAYCLGIVGTFTVLGLASALIFGAGAIGRFAADPWVNLVLAALFIVMAINLFGGFEIVIPAWLVEKTQSGSRGTGFIGPILMGLTFTLTSFTCTFAFVGTLLAAAATGEWFYPLVGMVGFSTAFASPFFLLALFPDVLARMPKSGGWLVTVKAYMGFLELAAAVKFLSNADLAWSLAWLIRPVFLALWAVIAFVTAIFMLGWIQLGHGSHTQVGWVRRVVGLVTAALGVWCLAGLNGADMKELSAFLPPIRYPGRSAGLPGGPPGAEVAWLEDYDKARAEAQARKKLLFLNFTGVT